MYSVVLAAMLTAGGEAPGNWGRGCHGCHGCHGCYGGGYAFGGYGCSGCWGCYGCSGCWGCYGGSGCYGCYGCHGCWGGYGVASSYGCYGCYGGCYGGYGCHGCYGGTVVVVQPPAPPPKDPKKNGKEGTMGNGNGNGDTVPVSQLTDRARVTVHLPADAKLFVDSVACPLTSETRSFTTPKLDADRHYFYTVRAEVVRNGQTMTQSQRVVVAAGQHVEVSFSQFTPTRTVQR